MKYSPRFLFTHLLKNKRHAIFNVETNFFFSCKKPSGNRKDAYERKKSNEGPHLDFSARMQPCTEELSNFVDSVMQDKDLSVVH